MNQLATFWNARSDRTRRWLISSGILTTAGLLSLLIFVTGPGNLPEAPAEKAWPVSTVRAQPGPMAPTFTGFGHVQSRALAKLTSDISANVIAVNVFEGAVVNEGDLLIALDDRQYRLSVMEREASLAQQRANLASVESELVLARATANQHESMQRIAQAKLARHRELMRDRLISQSLFDEVERSASQVDIEYKRHQQQLQQLPFAVKAVRAEVAKAEALLESARLDLAKTKLRAPFSGPVIAVNAAVGDRLLPGTVLLEMADRNAFELRVPIPDAYVQQVRRALAGSTVINGRSDLGTTRLTRLASAVAQGQSGVDGFFDLAELSTHQPAVGQLVEVHVELPQVANVLALPPQAIYENERIYAVVDQRLKPITVRHMGEARNRDGTYQVLVQSPTLSHDDEIVTTQLPSAISGLLVAPRREATTVVRNQNEPRTPKHPGHARPALMQDTPAPNDDAAGDEGNAGGDPEQGPTSRIGYPRLV